MCESLKKMWLQKQNLLNIQHFDLKFKQDFFKSFNFFHLKISGFQPNLELDFSLTCDIGGIRQKSVLTDALQVYSWWGNSILQN